MMDKDLSNDEIIYNLEAVNDELTDHSKRITLIYKPEQTLRICGWAVDKKAKAAANSVSVLIDDVEYETKYGIPRIDVATHFNTDAYIFCGFEVRIPYKELGMWRHSLALKIITKDGKVHFKPKVKADMVIYSLSVTYFLKVLKTLKDPRKIVDIFKRAVAYFFTKRATILASQMVFDEKTYYACELYSHRQNRPKIIHAIANLLTGGSSRLVVDLIEHLGHKYDQEIISFRIPTPLAYAGMVQHDFSGNVTEKQIRTFLKEKKAQILHVHYWGDPWSSKVLDAVESWPGILIENINTPIEPYISDRIDHYVYVSEYAKSFARGANGRFSVIFPGSNLSLFDRKNAHIPDDTIGMVYRLEPDKLKGDAIRVFIEVVKRRPKTQVMIIGGGTFLDAYQTQVADEGVSANFQFTGFVHYGKLPEYYKKLSVFVAPVWKESFGQVSPFAMGMKIPVVGYRTGALPEILGSEDLLAKDTDKLVDIIVNLLDNRQRRIEIGENNYSRAHKYYSLETMIAAYDQLYEKEIHWRKNKG